MTGFQIVIMLVCAGLGFGIVNNMINASRGSKQADDAEHRDHDPPGAS